MPSRSAPASARLRAGPLTSCKESHVFRPRHPTGHRSGDAQRPRERSRSPGAHRRLPPADRRTQAQRHRHHLRPAGHPDHRPDPPRAGRGHARDLLPPRAERRQRRRGRRLPDPEAGHLPHGLGAGLPERPHGAGQRDRQLLPDDPDQRLQRARDRRPAAGRLRGDGPAQRRQALLQGRLPRAPRAGHRHRHRAGDPLGALGPPRRRLPRPAGQAVLADDGRRGRPQLAGQGGRSGAAPAARARHGAARARGAQGRQAPADPARQGCGLRPGRQRDPPAGREDRHPLPADVDGQGPAARHPSAVGLRGTLLRAGRSRRGDAGGRQAQLAALARQGQDLGRTRAEAVHPDRHRADRDGQQRADRRAPGRRHRLLRLGPAGGYRRRLDEAPGRMARRDLAAQGQEPLEDGRDAGAARPRR